MKPLAFLLLLLIHPPPAALAAGNYDALYRKHGAAVGIDPLLLKAFAIVESAEDPRAVNPRDPSYGLMQVQCLDNGRGGCGNPLNVEQWPPARKDRLFDPDYNVLIASQILAWDIHTYGFLRGIAVYNNWAARFSPPNGPFPNQRYVDSVLREYRRLRAQGAG